MDVWFPLYYPLTTAGSPEGPAPAAAPVQTGPAPVAADLGRVAIQRGPVVYCFEAVDNGGPVKDIVLARDPKFTAEHRDDLLGGVTIKSDWGLEGHSDADVLLHALTDALLGSLALPDIGTLFSDTDLMDRWCSDGRTPESRLAFFSAVKPSSFLPVFISTSP